MTRQLLTFFFSLNCPLFQTGSRVRLSQQVLMDCSWGFGNNACNGGEEFRAYQWVLKHGGIPSEFTYGPYLGMVCPKLYLLKIYMLMAYRTSDILYCC